MYLLKTIVFLLINCFSLNSFADDALLLILRENNAFLYEESEPKVILDSNAHLEGLSLKNLNLKTKHFLFENKDKTLISGRYEEYLRLPTLTHNVRYKEIITSETVDLTLINVQKIRSQQFARNVADIIGKTPKGFLYANSPLYLQDLINPPLINKGDLVEVLYENDFVAIKTTAVAMQDGAINDFIKLKNSRTGTEIQGIVVSKNKVQIQ